MAIVQLTKEFQIVWNANLEIILKISKTNVSTGCNSDYGFEADTQAEIDAKITELGLTTLDNV